MLNPRPESGTKIWGNDVNADYQFIPREVTYLYHDRGLVWYETEHGQKFGWYAEQFFYTKEESQAECDLLNREANGEKVRSSLVEHEIGLALKESATRGPVRIC